LPAVPSPPLPPAPAPPFGRYLRDPGPVTARLLHHVMQTLTAAGTRLGPALAAAAVLALVGAVARRRAHDRRLARGARLVQLLAPPEVEPGAAAALWANLVALLRPRWARWCAGQPHLGFEITADAAGLQIALWVPATVPPGMVERAVQAAWPGARTRTVPAAAPLPAGPLLSAGGQLRLAGPQCYPLRTEHPDDPLRPLLGALVDLDADQTACVQILARPVTGRRVARLHRAGADRRAGRRANPAGRLLDLLTPGAGHRRADSDPERAGDVAAILAKAAQPCWAVAIRYTISSTAGDQQAAARLRGRAHGIASAFAMFTGRNRLERTRLRRPAAVLTGRRLGRGMLLSVPELAELAHLPTDPAVPGLARAGARAVSPPPAVGAAGKLLGDSEGAARRPVALAVADARQHLHILGATGSGKSTLLTNLILGDVNAGRGVVVIDPKGDLIADVIDRLPPRAAQRTVLLDPDESGAPPALNVLEGADPDLTVDNLVGIFRAIFERFWGPRTDDVLRSACLTLIAHAARTGRGASLADVPRLLGDPAFRRAATAGLADPAGLGGFWAWYEGLGDAARAQVVGPLLNKLRAFLLREFVRKVVGSPASSFDMAHILDGGICLVRVPKGILGEETARLLGSFVVAKVWQAAAHRARLGQPARIDAALYVDECQNFLTLPRSFDEMLAEARGYRLSLVLAHQHLGQLPRDLREAVSANARSKVFFAVSPEDARALERHVTPELSAHDLAHLPAYTAAARLVVDGEQTPAFTLRTRAAPVADPPRGAALRAAARARYGRTEAQRAAPRLLSGAAPERTQPGRSNSQSGPGSGIESGIGSGIGSGIALSSDPPLYANHAGQAQTRGSTATADSVGKRE